MHRLVVFLHTSSALSFFAEKNYPEPARLFNDIVGPYRMPFLMFMSGMFLHRSLNESVGANIRGKFDLIFWPFLIWSLVVYAAEGRLTLEYVLKTPISAPSLLWYLWFLTAYYLLALLADRLRLSFLVLAAVFLAASSVAPGGLRIDRFCFLFAFFLLGHVAVIREVKDRVTLPLALVGLVAALAGSWISVRFGTSKYDPLYAWAPLGLIAFVLYISRFYHESALTRPFEWIGRNSIVFYVAHFPVLVFLARKVFFQSPISSGLLYAILFLVTLLAASLLQAARSRSRAVAALFDFSLLRGSPRPSPSAQATSLPK
ncbi:acyltransferase family protein [Frigidibacter sp. MR17.24]